MAVNAIVAVGNLTPFGFPIGKEGKTPWHHSGDLKWFKETTMGHPVIMGRKTATHMGKPLPGRTNIVITQYDNFEEEYEGFITATSLEQAIGIAKTKEGADEIYIIGGGHTYKYAIDNGLVDVVLMDMLSYEVPDADTFFPNIMSDPLWEETGTPIEIEKRKAYVVTYTRLRGQNNHVDEQYLNLVNRIIKEGVVKHTRAGDTRSIFGVQMRFNLQEGLPMLTTKKMFAKGVIHELLWFLKGNTNIKYLVDNDVHIWDDDAYRYYLELFNERFYEHKIALSKEAFLDNVKKSTVSKNLFNRDGSVYRYGDLGPVYGKQWRSWGGGLSPQYNPDGSFTYRGYPPVDQIKEVIETLRKNPDDRRMIVSAWNPTDIPNMALPPCHYSFQFYTKVLTLAERQKFYTDQYGVTEKDATVDILDSHNIPKRKLSCMWNQRSVDWGLGASFNFASYAILTHLIAHCCNMVVDELIFSGGDVHIYENQIEGLTEQLKRNPHRYALPKLSLRIANTNIDAFEYRDIKIVGYESYPSIKLPLSVGLK